MRASLTAGGAEPTQRASRGLCAPCGGERGLHQALLELCNLCYLKLNRTAGGTDATGSL